jgi:Mg-chelatase subunit ChlD
MRKFVLVSLWIGVLLAAAVHFEWTDAFHLGAGAVLLTFPVALTLWIRRHHYSDDVESDEEMTSHPARALLIHGFCAILCIAYLAFSFQLLHTAGFGILAHDQDRVSFEERLQVLDDAHQYDRAAVLIEDRLDQPISDSWKHVIAKRLCLTLINAGKNAKTLPERRERLKKAIEIASRYQLDGSLAVRLDEECQQEGAYLDRLAALRGNKDWRTLAIALEAGLIEDAASRRHLPLSSWLRNGLVEWAQELNSSRDKKEKLMQAMDICANHGLDNHVVRLALELVDKESRPAALPFGAKGGVINVVSDYFPPVLIADVWVDTAAGRPVEKLREKDFQIRVGDSMVSDFVLHEENRDVVQTHCLVAIDTSGSMEGAAIAAAEAGSIKLIRGLHRLGHGQLWVKTLTFHSEIVVRSQWTKDLLQASDTLKGLKAHGGTALLKTVMYGVKEFKGRTGHKHLLLLTDGKDEDGGPDVDTLVAACKKEGIVISAIGLRSSVLDAATLRRLSGETGGTYVEANGPEHLLEQFQRAGLRVRPHFYRLVIRPNGSTPGNLTIRIGADNGLQLTGP